MEELPSPFNKPDFIIFEEIYCFHPIDRMVQSVLKSEIPFSIIPRCSLTKTAQHRHYFKKKLANLFFYNNFIKKSQFIQYLTSSEQIESVKHFNHKSVIIPNGINIKLNQDKAFNKDKIRATYIGRLELGQKGLDLMVVAISSLKEFLRSENFTLYLYGPNIEGSSEKLNKIIKDNEIDDIVKISDGVFGADKELILQQTDVFVMTSRYEGMPMGLIEALSYGIPCVVTKGTFMAEDIQEIGAGWDAGSSVDTIKETLRRMVKEKDSFQTKSVNAKKLASKYSWDNLAKELHKEIENHKNF